MKQRLLLSAALSGALLATAACGGGSSSPSEAAPSAADGKLNVITSFYPVGWLTEKVGGTHVSVDTLTKPGTEPHDLELSPKQIAEISDAKLTVYVKGLQPAVDDAVDKNAKDKAFDAISAVKTLPATEEEEHEGEEAGHEEVEYDPHVWLDPSRLATIATALGDKLATTDAAHAAEYKANASKIAGELTKLDGEFKTGLGTCKQNTIITTHAAFSYLADRYGLKQLGISGIDPESEPSPRRVAELTKVIKDTGVTTVFSEVLVSPKTAQTLAEAAGVKTSVLDPIEGVQSASDDYLSIQRKNLEALRAALSCS